MHSSEHIYPRIARYEVVHYVGLCFYGPTTHRDQNAGLLMGRDNHTIDDAQLYLRHWQPKYPVVSYRSVFYDHSLDVGTIHHSRKDKVV